GPDVGRVQQGAGACEGLVGERESCRLEDRVGPRPRRHVGEWPVRGDGHGRWPRRRLGCRAAGRARGEHGYGEREEEESGRHGWLLSRRRGLGSLLTACYHAAGEGFTSAFSRRTSA